MAVNFSVQPLSHSFPMEISDIGWGWGKMCAALDLVDKKGIRLSSVFWVACTRLPSGGITRGLCCVLNLLTQGISTLM